MLSFNTLQKYYVELYKNLRKYIWDFSTVEKLVDLEIEVHRKFPDLDAIRKCLSKLEKDISEEFLEDEDLKSAYDEFADILDSEDDGMYSKINQVREVVSDEN